MQNESQDLFSMLFPQSIAMADPLSVFSLYILAPGLIIFTVVILARELLRPRWRGYWDAV